MSLILQRPILKATKLVPNFNHSDYGYGASGLVEPGHIALVLSIGSYRPEHGLVWLRDDSHTFWEVTDEELQKAL
jgi:hypothetical protein